MNRATIRAAVANCTKFKKQHHRSKDPMVKSYVKVKPKQLVDILVKTKGPAKKEARILLEAMAAQKWQIAATLHEGGHPKNDEPDLRPHFTIRIGNSKSSGRHIRCRIKGGRVFVLGITKKKIKE